MKLFNYMMRRKRDDKDLYDELSVFLQHVLPYGIEVKSILFDKNGDVRLNVLGELNPEQMEHVGIEPLSKQEF